MAQRRAKGVLKVKRRDALGAIKRSKRMAKGFADNAALFSKPNPPLPVFKDQITETDKAQVAVSNGGKGAAAARDVQLGLLMGMMSSELLYIQSLADAATPDEAVSILLAGGVEVAEVSKHDKAILAVKQGPKTGSAVLEANARVLLGDGAKRKHFFCWEYTTDGTTFLALPSTPEARTAVSGLTPMTKVGFRVAGAKSKGVVGEWSPVVELLVQ